MPEQAPVMDRPGTPHSRKPTQLPRRASAASQVPTLPPIRGRESIESSSIDESEEESEEESDVEDVLVGQPQLYRGPH